MVGDLKKPHLVLIHGYAGSGAMFFRTYEKLTQHFCIFVIDLIGMGGSSRPDNYDGKNISEQESIDYFVEYIEAWRKNIPKYIGEDPEKSFTNFYMAAHSFGGYMAGNYALKYH